MQTKVEQVTEPDDTQDDAVTWNEPVEHPDAPPKPAGPPDEYVEAQKKLKERQKARKASEPKEDEPCCGNCGLWREVGRTDAGPGKSGTVEVGDCLRFPQTVSKQKKEWCAEYAIKGEKE